MIRVELLVFDAVDVLDVGGPYEVLLTANRLLVRDGAAELFDVRVVAADEGASTAHGGLGLLPTATTTDDPVDVFLVPGAVDLAGVRAQPGLLDLIARRSARAGLTASVCTGALLLAHAGLLEGVQATTHHEDVGDLADLIGTELAVAARWVDAGHIVTSGGLSAGIAMALHLVERFSSRDLAQRTARQIAYDWDPTDGVVVAAPAATSTDVIDTFLRSAEIAAELLEHGAVEHGWSQPSALVGYDIAGLAGHLSRAVLTVESYLDTRPATPPAAVTDAAGYLAAVLGDADPVDSDLHRAIRERSAAAAAGGAPGVASALREAVARLQVTLRAKDGTHIVQVRDGLALPLGEYLATRIVELVVHIDDLTVSLDLTPPQLPPDAYLTAAAVLARTAVLRIDGLQTVRALARRERHPGQVSAL